MGELELQILTGFATIGAVVVALLTGWVISTLWAKVFPR